MFYEYKYFLNGKDVTELFGVNLIYIVQLKYLFKRQKLIHTPFVVLKVQRGSEQQNLHLWQFLLSRLKAKKLFANFKISTLFLHYP